MTDQGISHRPEILDESGGALTGGRPICGSTDRGFSLMELVVVIAILLVLSVFAAPAVTNAIHSYQLTASLNNVAAAVERARYEAIRQNCLMSTGYHSTTNPPEFYVQTTSGVGCASHQPTNMTYALSSNTVAADDGPSTCAMTGSYASAAFPSGYDVTFSPTGTAMQKFTTTCSLGSTGCVSSTVWLEGNSMSVFYVENTLSQNWAAVTVTPSGYIEKWNCQGGKWVQQ